MSDRDLRTSTKLISMSEAAFWTAVDAAEERGARMALEAAAKVADEMLFAIPVATAIRQTDPTYIVKGQSDAE